VTGQFLNDTSAHYRPRKLSTVGHGPQPIHVAPISDSRPSARHQPKLPDHGGQCRAIACLLPSFCRYQFIPLCNRGTWV